MSTTVVQYYSYVSLLCTCTEYTSTFLQQTYSYEYSTIRYVASSCIALDAVLASTHLTKLKSKRLSDVPLRSSIASTSQTLRMRHVRDSDHSICRLKKYSFYILIYQYSYCTGCMYNILIQAFEVESSTRARDLVAAISSRLQLKTSNCFAVFVKVGDKGMNKNY